MPTVRTFVSTTTAVVLLATRVKCAALHISRSSRAGRDQYMKTISSHPKYCNHKNYRTKPYHILRKDGSGVAGDSKGQTAKVLKVEVSKQRAIVEGV